MPIDLHAPWGGLFEHPDPEIQNAVRALVGANQALMARVAALEERLDLHHVHSAPAHWLDEQSQHGGLGP